MTCTEARELLLDADPALLRGEGDGELVRHLAGCSACAAEARVLLDALNGLDAALAAMASRPPAVRIRRPRPGRVLVPFGLAAAAALVVLLYPRDPSRPAPRENLRASTRVPRGVEVDLAASPKTVAVFATADPTITVVWYF